MFIEWWQIGVFLLASCVWYYMTYNKAYQNGNWLCYNAGVKAGTEATVLILATKKIIAVDETGQIVPYIAKDDLTAKTI